jgi:hypothetical protein
LQQDKNTHFDQGAGMKWRLCDKCWLCDKFRYTVIVFNRSLADQYFSSETELVRDPKVNEFLRRKYISALPQPFNKDTTQKVPIAELVK